MLLLSLPAGPAQIRRDTARRRTLRQGRRHQGLSMPLRPTRGRPPSSVPHLLDASS
jgi:hypothetical protein